MFILFLFISSVVGVDANRDVLRDYKHEHHTEKDIGNYRKAYTDNFFNNNQRQKKSHE
jgi:hypothetical protein